jgi:hypothetical protein
VIASSLTVISRRSCDSTVDTVPRQRSATR